MANARAEIAAELMMRFADRTGLSSDRPPRRYLWTDAFAVCNLLGLARAFADRRYQELALDLVRQVHHELGRHRADDPRDGWLSGLSAHEAEAHPTLGGLRIGKPLPERGAAEPADPDLEWMQDGQYFHYLTKWMHALDQVARSTGDGSFNVWARELAEVAHRAFTYGPPGRKRMVWKLSTDLSRPLVASMGQHDPLDGLVTCQQLEATADALRIATGPRPHDAVEDFAEMLASSPLVTDDPLGLGGLLVDACRLAQLGTNDAWIGPLLSAACAGLQRYVVQPSRAAPAHRRLAFRELGLAIGLEGVAWLEDDSVMRRLGAAAQASVVELVGYVPLAAEIEAFWLRPEHRATATWTEHQDIDDVMLATCLAPDGFLALGTRVDPSLTRAKAPTRQAPHASAPAAAAVRPSRPARARS